MADENKNPNRYRYHFIHNTFAQFFSETLNYFKDHLHTRFRYASVTTYDKAVEYMTKKDQYGREIDTPLLPAIILNPSGEFSPSDTGKQLFRYPNLAPGLAGHVFHHIYQDNNVKVYVSFERLKGEIEIINLFESFYEYCDVRMLYLQIFGGYERPIYPLWINGFLILPEELYNYRYENDITGESYTLKWDEEGVSERLMRTTNTTEYIYPCQIKPFYKITSMSDGSTRYGGTDKLADWRLVTNIEYEIEMPVYIVLKSNYLAENIHMEIRYSGYYTDYSDEDIPVNRNIIKSHWDFGMDNTSSTDILVYPDEAEITERKDLVLNIRYFHIITEAEADSTADIFVTMPEPVIDKDMMILNSRSGKLSYGDHYTLETNGTILRLIQENVTFHEDDVLELYIYKEV